MRVKTFLSIAFAFLISLPVLADYEYLDDNNIVWRYELVNPNDLSQGVTMTTTVTDENINTINGESYNHTIPENIRLNESSVPVVGISLIIEANLPDYAFPGCHNLTSVVFSANVTEIGARPFWDCPNLTSIVIDEGNTVYTSRGKVNIDDENETNCNVIVEKETQTLLKGCGGTVIPCGVERIVDDAFIGSSTAMTSLSIPASVTEIEGSETFLGCDNLTSIVVDEGNTVYTSRGTVNGTEDTECNAIIKKSTNTLIRGCGNTVIPDEVTILGAGAFRGCQNLETITIPENITQICNFESCSKLTTVNILAPVVIPGYTFNACPKLTTVNMDNVTGIDDCAFRGCPLEKITIPASVTNISSSAFCYVPALIL